MALGMFVPRMHRDQGRPELVFSEHPDMTIGLHSRSTRVRCILKPCRDLRTQFLDLKTAQPLEVAHQKMVRDPLFPRQGGDGAAMVTA